MPHTVMHIPVIFSFARSGGTLVNQLLGVHPDCLVLSEINPAASVISVARQASDWMGLIEAGEIERFQALPYSQQIIQLNELARSRGKTLIIRDWVTVNYLADAGSSVATPSHILEQSVYLAHAGYALQPLVITRKAAAVYRSIRQNFTHLANLSTKDFTSAYLAYARAVSSFPRISLESLQASPRVALLRILQALTLSIEHVDKQLEAFADFRMCTGNNSLAVPSASSHARIIMRQANREPATDESCIHAESLAEADILMGYEP